MTLTLTNRATDVRAILGNVIKFFEENQAAALALASPDVALAPLTFYRTAEMLLASELATLPHFGCVRRRVATQEPSELSEGMKTIVYNMTWQLEVSAEHKKETRTEKLLELQRDTDNYVYALELMSLNIPQDRLYANVGEVAHDVLSVETSDPLEVAVSDTKSLFNVEMAVMLRFFIPAYLF